MGFRDKILHLISGDPVSVGLDIGSHSVKIVKVAHTSNGPLLLSAGIHVFKEGTIEGGEIKNRDELINAITSLVNRADTSGKIRQVNFALSWSHGVVADRIHLRSIKGQPDEELILTEAGRHSPFDVEDIQLDYKILKKDPKSSEMEVLLVAAKNQVMQPFLSLLQDAGLEAINVDVDTFAIANAYLFSANPQDEEKVICLANIGQNVTNLTFITNGTYHSTRDVSTAGSYFVHSLEKELGINTAEAVAVLKNGAEASGNPDAYLRAIEEGAEELSVGLDLAFSYFQSSDSNLEIDKLLISGGGACIDGLAELLSHRHNIPVEILDPFAQIKCDPKKFKEAIPLDISTTLTVSAGLAFRKF